MQIRKIATEKMLIILIIGQYDLILDCTLSLYCFGFAGFRYRLRGTPQGHKDAHSNSWRVVHSKLSVAASALSGMRFLTLGSCFSRTQTHTNIAMLIEVFKTN